MITDRETSAADPSSVNAASASSALHASRNTLSATYFAVALFSIVYFGRPEDWIPGASALPFAKITGTLAALAFAFGLASGRKLVLTKELRLLLALFGWLCLTIPFSTWRGGSFNLVLFDFSKVVLITCVLLQAANSPQRLHKLIFIHTITVLIVSGFSIYAGASGKYGSRTSGVLGGIFGNPNDLAANIVLIFPFALAFLLLSTGIVRKLFWGGALAILAYAVMVTYSRGGFLSLIMVIISSLFLLRRKERRPVIAMLALAGVAVIALGVNGDYLNRLATIWNPNADVTGSAAARSDLLMTSLLLTLKHPLFGIGPGQFAVASGNWHVAHNTYTEFSSEAGLPAAILFLAMSVSALKKARRLARDEGTTIQVRLLATALAMSLLGLFVSMFFASMEYLFVTYFLVAYISALSLLAEKKHPATITNPAREPGWGFVTPDRSPR